MKFDGFIVSTEQELQTVQICSLWNNGFINFLRLTELDLLWTSLVIVYDYKVTENPY